MSDDVAKLLDGEPRRVALEELTERFGEELVRADIAAFVQDRVMYLHDNQDKLTDGESEAIEGALGLDGGE